MTQKTLFSTAGTIFLLVALLHLARSAFGWSATIGGLDVPMWISWIAILVAGSMAYQCMKFSK